MSDQKRLKAEGIETSEAGAELKLQALVEPEAEWPNSSLFFVDERAYCLWDWDIPERNRQYLATLNGSYFDYVANLYEERLKAQTIGVPADEHDQESEEAQYIAITLRTTYSHALETLLALICAAVQAPNCVAGWMLKYKNEDLRQVVQKIHEGRPLKTRLMMDSITWDTLPTALLCMPTGDVTTDNRTRARFGELWRRLAEEFLDEVVEKEYTSFKHGLRLTMHGFTLLVGLQSEPDVAPPPDDMHLLAHNKFGSSFYSALPIRDKDAGLRLIRQSVNWRPEKYIKLLQLISMSIDNIANMLKRGNGMERSVIGTIAPTEDSLFDEAWSFRLHEARMTFSSLSEVSASYLPVVTKEAAKKIAGQAYHTANSSQTDLSSSGQR